MTKTPSPFDRPYLSKQQALDLMDKLRKEKTAISGLEVFRFHNGEWETTMYKSIWFKSQRGVYASAVRFIRHQMAGEWQWVEIKLIP